MSTDTYASILPTCSGKSCTPHIFPEVNVSVKLVKRKRLVGMIFGDCQDFHVTII